MALGSDTWVTVPTNLYNRGPDGYGHRGPCIDIFIYPMILQTERKIQIRDKEITVRKLPIRKFAEVVAELKQIPVGLMKFADNKTATQEDLIIEFTKVLINGVPELASVISKAIDGSMTADEILDLYADEVLELVGAVISINNIAGIIESAKKIGVSAPTLAK